MATLYEMTENAKTLYELLQAEEIDEQTVSDTLEAMETEKKLEDYVYVIKELQSDIDKFKAEEKRIADRRKSLENSLDRVKTAVQNFMTATGQEKTKAGTFSLRLTHTSAVNITDEKLIPAEFLVPQPDKISKAEIKKALKEGKTISGAELITNTSVTIR